MTATTVQGARVSGLIAEPQTIIGRGLHASVEQIIKLTIEIPTTSSDETGDITLFTEVPWEAKIHSILLFNDSLAASAIATDVGLYKLTKAGTVTVLDADAYGSAVTGLETAGKVGLEVAFEARNIDKIGNRVIEDAGLTAEPDDGYALLGITITTGGTTPAAGTLSVIVKYTM